MRYLIYIVTSVCCILFPIVALIYMFWDAAQPKTGPVGNGVQSPTFPELLPLFSTLLLGIINLPVAVIRYKEKQRNPHNELDADQMRMRPRLWEEQANQANEAAPNENLRLQEAKEIISALEAEIRRKRKNAQVYIAIATIDDDDKEKDSETVIRNFLSRFEAFKPGEKLDEIDEPNANKLLEYALTKQMVHDLDVMSDSEAHSIIRDFLRLFDSPDRKLFTNGTYNNGLMWRSIMKESHGIVYFDTGTVVVTNELTGILWIADKG